MRTTVTLLLVLACCPVLVAAETLPPDLGTRRAGIDWPDFLGPGRTSKSPETGLMTDWAEKPPRIVWKAYLGTSYGTPAISRGRLLHFDRFGDKARLTCRKSETGKKLWAYEHDTKYSDMLGYNNGPRCSPVIDGNRVYTYSAEGQLHCVSLDAGELIWNVDTFEQFGVIQNFFGVGSTPIVFDDLLIVSVGGSPPGGPPDIYSAQGNVESNGTGVVAFDKFTGKVVWQATDEFAGYASPVLATIDDRPWCFIFARSGLIGLDPRNGKADFHFPWRAKLLESVNASCPVVVGNRVFISETYSVGSALLEVGPGGDDAEGYEVVWQDGRQTREKALELHWNTAVHHEGFLYASSGRHRAPAELRCIEMNTGKVRWSEPNLERSSLLQIDGHFICQSEDGTVRLLRVTPERYEMLAELNLRDDEGGRLLRYPAWAAPIVSHGLLYVRGKGRLVCLEVIPERQ